MPCLPHKRRCDWIRTSDLYVPNVALYQAEPRIDNVLYNLNSPYNIANLENYFKGNLFFFKGGWIDMLSDKNT